MSAVTFLLLLVIAAAAAGLRVLISSDPAPRGRPWAACFVAYAVLLVAPTLLQRLLGG